MRHGGRSNAPQVHDLAAIHFRIRANGLEDQQASFVGQCFGDFLNLRPIHPTVPYQQCSERIGEVPSAAVPLHFSDITYHLDVHLTVEVQERARLSPDGRRHS